MTNFEKIKQMTVEEFAKMFGNGICENISNCLNTIDCTADCDDCIIDWLNQEVEE
jgi:hypothetical protein